MGSALFAATRRRLVLWNIAVTGVIIVAFASYLTWFWLVSRYPAGRLSAFTFLTPLLGLVAGAMLLGDPVSWALVAALLLVGFGIYLVNRPPPQPVASGTTGAPTKARSRPLLRGG